MNKSQYFITELHKEIDRLTDGNELTTAKERQLHQLELQLEDLLAHVKVAKKDI